MRSKGRKYLGIFLTFFAIYYLTSAGRTPYDYFVRLADAFLDGRYWLLENPPWLSELIPVGDGRFYTVYPPGPAVLLIPFVLILGGAFQQQIFAHGVGALMVVIAYELSLQIKKDQRLALWSMLLVGVSNIGWYMSSTGSVWYLGQTTAATLMFAAMLSAQRKKVFLTGLLLGIAYISRIHTILSLPFYLYLLRSELKHFKKIYRFFYPMIVFLGLNALYNFVRFGTPMDRGYFLLPAALGEENAAWFSRGVVHPLYYLENIRTMFLSLPIFLSVPPYIQPSWYGLSILITTPAFVFAFWARAKDYSVKLGWLSIFLISLVVMAHGGTGWTQFGYRFAVDYYAILFYLTILGVARMGLSKIHWMLLSCGIVVNLWGVLWINKFGWVGF